MDHGITRARSAIDKLSEQELSLDVMEETPRNECVVVGSRSPTVWIAVVACPVSEDPFASCPQGASIAIGSEYLLVSYVLNKIF